MSYSDFQTFLNNVLAQSGLGNQLFADGFATTWQEVLQKMDRQSLIQDLKQKAQQAQLRAKDWVPNSSRIDYMTVTERDIRMMMTNRVQAFRLRNSAIPKTSLQEFSDAQTNIEK